MIKCPFCHFDNEDGALFCEQCKSDLSGVAAAPVMAVAVPVMAEAEPMMAEAIPVMAEAIPMMAEAIPVMAEAEPMMAEAVPVMAEAVPVMPEISLEPIPVVAEAILAEPIAPLEAAPAPPPPPVAPPPPVVAVAPAPPAPAPVPTPAPAPAAAAAAPAAGGPLPAGSQPRLVVLRGQKRNVEYPVYEGLNFIGRADDKPVDIDLEDQEPPDRVWCSRQHACISFEADVLAIEDLNSANGTYVNRARIYPGQRRTLVPGDIVQIGNVQLKVVV
jgi:FHA domain